MDIAPEKIAQIIKTHAALIHHVVTTCHQPALRPQMDEILKASEVNGWHDLVAAMRKILNGDRSINLLQGLDEEDAVIIERILRALQNPDALPALGEQSDPSAAAPGLAGLIDAASKGDPQALQVVGEMSEQMSQAGGSMKILAARIRPLVNGERDEDILCKDMDTKGKALILSILSELSKLQYH